MSVLTTRGGVPHVLRDTFTTTGREVRFPFACLFLKVRAATAPAKLFFSEADFTAGINYVVVPITAAATPYGMWEGPAEATKVWIKGDGGSSAVELVAFQRRG